MKVVITGSSGFIGFHAAKKFLDNGFEVVGIDNENDYYDCRGELFWWIFEDKSHNFMLEAEQFTLTKVTLNHFYQLCLWYSVLR